MKFFKSLLTLFALFTLIFWYQNCSQPGFYLDLNQKSLAGFFGLSDPLNEKPSYPHFNLMSANQVYQSFLNLAEVPNESIDIRNEFNLRRSSFSDQGDVYSINAPYLLASTSLAGTVCRDLVNREAQNVADGRRYFVGVNFTTGVGALSDTVYLDVANRLAESFWKMSLSNDQRASLIEFKSTFLEGVTDSNVQTVNLLTATCAAILGSFNVSTL
ncbi:MAG: hypothetical protein NZ480_06015 [Bdellovibrionaceae bacterium]|nr:hypothetical protein [Pseudobdellovibrionaceae bacterium]MDW8190590.1 hypothetical protein [Pseudobdellovibrionaceae bacterium]